MPIPANPPTVLTTTTPLPIICPVCKDSNSCPKHCSNKTFTKSYEMVERELKTRSSVEQPKRAPSLACRSEDEQWVDISNQRLRGTQMGALYPGSKFKGVQKSGKTSYEVAVKIQVGRKWGTFFSIILLPSRIFGIVLESAPSPAGNGPFRTSLPIWIPRSGQLKECLYSYPHLPYSLACWSSWIVFEWISEHQRAYNWVSRTYRMLDISISVSCSSVLAYDIEPILTELYIR